MTRNITYNEYKRRVFNRVIVECFCNIHGRVLNGACQNNSATPDRFVEMAENMCKTFINEELCLNNATIAQTKKRLCESGQFLIDACEAAEDIADKKAACAKEEKMEIPDNQEIHLSDEDKEVLKQLFDVKGPTPEIGKIRDATVNALLAEDRKAEEIRNAIDIARSDVKSHDASSNVLEETVKRLNQVGPTSLMNAIINNISVSAIKEVNSNPNSGFRSISDIMTENADEIKTRAVAVYSLYEMASVFHLHTFTPNEVKTLSHSIYYNK